MGTQRQINICIIFFPSVGKHHRRGTKEFVRAKCWEVIVFWTQQGHCTHEFTIDVVTCIRSAQGQDSQHSNMAEGWARKTPLMSGELLAGDGYFRGMVPGRLIALAPADGPIPVHINHTN